MKRWQFGNMKAWLLIEKESNQSKVQWECLVINLIKNKELSISHRLEMPMSFLT